MRLALVRHSAVRVAPGVCYGRLDVALAEPAELDPIIDRLRDFVIVTIWTSPALRCRRVAEALAARHGAEARRGSSAFAEDDGVKRRTPADVKLDDRLQELDFGAWEGRAWDTIGRAALDAWAADPRGFAPPGGETGNALIARVTAFFNDVMAADGDYVVVAHGGPLRVLRALAAGRTVDLLAPAPALGSVEVYRIATSALSTAHSASCSVAPSVSPV